MSKLAGAHYVTHTHHAFIIRLLSRLNGIALRGHQRTRTRKRTTDHGAVECRPEGVSAYVREELFSTVPEGVSVNTRGPEIILGLMFRGMSEVSEK